MGWGLTASGLSVFDGAGVHWSVVPLPSGVRSESITDITASADGGVWLGVPRGAGVDVYRHRGEPGEWTRTTLRPFKSAGLSVGNASPQGSVTLGPGRLVTVIAGWRLTTSVAYYRLFVSTDSGATFTQHAAPTGVPIGPITFLDATHGVTVGGPTGAPRFVFHTADGGRSWNPVTIPVHVTRTQQAVVGDAVADSSALRLPVLIRAESGDQLVIYTSTDGGASFTPPTTPPLQIPAAFDPGEVFPAILGNTAWFPVRGGIYESGDAGASWTLVSSNASPHWISLISGSAAVGVTNDSTCQNGTCHNENYLVVTTDGGRTWRGV